MPKLEIAIDSNYRRMARRATDIRTTLRETVHRPEKRATTRVLFLIGIAAIAICGSVLVAMR